MSRFSASADPLEDELVSIIINNYNYGRFLRSALDSALSQTYSPVEVVVVDDGSTDESREVIAAYGERIRPILTPNQGQAAAINIGIARSRGRYVCLLDADDTFMPEKVATCVAALRESGQLMDRTLVAHPLRVVDESGQPTGATEPAGGRRRYPQNLYEYAARYGYLPYAAAPTSGLTLSRAFLERLWPIPHEHTKTSADGPLVRAASLIGQVKWLPSVLASYRVHGANHFQGGSRLRTREQILVEEAFLNQKLREDGRDPVLDFFGSMFAREIVKMAGDRRALARLAITVVRRHPDAYTLGFFVRTLAMALEPVVTATGEPEAHRTDG